MQQIATENNLPITTFVVPEGEGYGLRWFTPTSEVELCGHGTLATAFVLFGQHPTRERLPFASKGGPLHVTRRGDLLELDFPAQAAQPWDAPPALIAALGAAPAQVLRATKILAVYDDAATVRGVRPDFAALAALASAGVVITAPADHAGVDFVSRYFAPHIGLNEDAVTGSAHCMLVPYWAQRLGKRTLVAHQVSARGGELFCTHAGERMLIAGRAVAYLRGTISV